jgi:prophage DNA circulation protein
MSTWRDQLKGGASYNGIKFFVSASESGGGRRVVKHEYPFKDTPFAEDLGRKAREFSLEGFVLGDDYMSARDALIDALESPGEGVLVHPFYGTRFVAVLDYRVRESSDAGGCAQFSISFGETSEAVQPTNVPDPLGAVGASASAAADSVQAEFTASYSPGVFLSSVRASVVSAIAAVRQVLSPIEFEAQQLATINLRLENLEDDLVELTNSPLELHDALSEIFATFTNGSRKALLRVYAFNPGVRPPATTVNRIQEQKNFDALYRLIQRLIVIRAAELILSETFDSYDAAIAAREEITDLLDDQAEQTTDDTFAALIQLRADVCKAVPGADSDLPRLVTVTPPVTMPSLVLAYQLYGNVEKEEDLIARNRVRNPGGVPGGKSLEVLSRG